MNDPVPSPPDVVYAGFWRRYFALFLDQLLVMAVLAIPAIAIVAAFGWRGASSRDTVGVTEAILYLLYFIVAPFYYALQESSAHQATLGKRALGIKVVDEQGRRITFGRAIGRWFAAALSYLTLYIGFLMAAFTRRKQALHDMIAGTLVVDRWAFTDQPERQKRGLSGCLVAVIVVVLVGIPLLGILAAIAIPAYQDYTVRAHVSQAIASAVPIEARVSGYLRTESRCPVNGEGGILDAEAYGDADIAMIETGAMQDSGRCGLQVTLRGPGPAAGKRLWLEFDPATGRWTCSSEIKDSLLPARCRG